MKKNSILLMALLMTFILVSCSSASTKSDPITISDLPGDIPCNDTQITLSAVSFCEVYAAHGYTGYCIATVDRSNLSDDDLYWMLNKETGQLQAEIDIVAYLTSEENSLESERLSQLQTIYNGENIYFMFYTTDVQRKHLNDFELTLQIIMSPEKSLIADTTQYYYYHLDAEEGVDYSDYEKILSSKEKDILVKALNNRIDSLKQGIGN